MQEIILIIFYNHRVINIYFILKTDQQWLVRNTPKTTKTINISFSRLWKYQLSHAIFSVLATGCEVISRVQYIRHKLGGGWRKPLSFSAHFPPLSLLYWVLCDWLDWGNSRNRTRDLRSQWDPARSSGHKQVYSSPSGRQCPPKRQGLIGKQGVVESAEIAIDSNPFSANKNVVIQYSITCNAGR